MSDCVATWPTERLVVGPTCMLAEETAQKSHSRCLHLIVTGKKRESGDQKRVIYRWGQKTSKGSCLLYTVITTVIDRVLRTPAHKKMRRRGCNPTMTMISPPNDRTIECPRLAKDRRLLERIFLSLALTFV